MRTITEIAFPYTPQGNSAGGPSNAAGVAGARAGHQLRAFQCFAAGAWQPRGATAAVEFDAQTVEMMAAVYSPATYTATLQISHGSSQGGSLGDVRGLIAVDGALFAVANVAPSLIDAVRAGKYPAVSARFFNPYDEGNPVPGALYLQHIAFLDPSSPPVVTGMLPPAFAAVHDTEPACFAAQGYGAPAKGSGEAVMFAVAQELAACSGGALRFIDAASHVEKIIRAR